MRPTFHPALVNGPLGDPALYVEFLDRRGALLFDLGEIPDLAPRKILRLTHVFVSHAHMDHFAGFDRLLRICLGRDVRLRLFGPPGFIDRVGHKLGGYTWNLVEGYANDLTLEVAEYAEDRPGHRARFRVRNGFRREELEPPRFPGGLLVDEDAFRVRAAELDHRIPCLAFALEEPEHLNVWRNRLEDRGLRPGPWLAELKAAVRREDPDATPIRVAWKDPGNRPATLPLGELRAALLSRERGQKVGYVVDAVDSPGNAARIVELVRGADRLYIEAAFRGRETDRAAATYHLTAPQAGRLAARAGVGELVPFHFSPRHEHEVEALIREAEEAFAADL
ncbi:ribonuclease Z [Thiohalorhabdus denitrificans]|uniref:Ribonuclease Z n=1 Tax=Thiohalorhabdus denitrificans TaxID=381306 RepID=A0A0P9GGH8_9GAMM|nr:PRK02126 family protein [Thiohalorhabdus denitrificans]KPV39126.1 ribonuclease Z [Thiohalorhabdus denitrificans]SCX76973.1 ribonuclease Z [Thiohalorhabdus denitrificans]